MKKFLLIALILSLPGCADSRLSSEVPHAPRSVQYDMALDWDYAIAPGPIKALGGTPIDQGGIVAAQGMTYVTSSTGKVVAIEDATARAVWTRDFGMPVTAGPVLDGNAMVIALSNGVVARLQLKTGETIWEFDAGVAVEKGLSVSDGVVALVNANNRVMAIDAQTGAQKWRRERPRSQEFSMYGQCAPLIVNGVVYAGFSDGYLVAYAISNGTAIWTRELAPKARFKDLDVTPLKVDDKLYVATSSGGLYALSADDGHTLWQRSIYGISAIRAFQDSLYLSSQTGIFRLRQHDGAVIWQNEIQKDALISPLELGKQSIYASVQRYGLVVLDRKSGKLEHVLDMGSDFTAAPYLGNGTLSALSNRAHVYRFIVDDAPAQ